MAAPQPSKHGRRRCTLQLVFFFLLSSSTAALAAAAVVPTSYSSHCASPSPAPDLHADVSNGGDADRLLSSSFHLQPSTGFFSGRGADSLFSSPANTNSDDDDGLHVHRRRRSLSFSFHPRVVSRTAEPTLLHLTATLTLFGCRVKTYDYDHEYDDGRRCSSNHSTTVSFDLDGYYSTTSSELCMVGTGTEAAAAAVLMAVHFDSFGEAEAQAAGSGHGKGRISSLRDSTDDDLYFEARDITFFGMGKGNRRQVSASIWRWMDPERIVTVASAMLFCVVFTVLWRLRRATSRLNREEPPAIMSMAMHVVVTSLGCVVALEFILSHWVFLLVTFVHMFS